jgi:hypothetical protein
LFFVVKNILLFAAAILQHKALGGWKAPQAVCGRGAFVIPLTVVIITTEDWDYGGASIICKENENKP